MKILVVNDDSISAPGIAVLAKAAAQFGDVWVVAPRNQCSAMSQKLTLRELISVEEYRDYPAPVREAWSIGGTPVDCVRVALDYILDEKPDYVFSGINNGYNVGRDIHYSGTAGAALEAVRQGIPAIAFSVTGDAHLEKIEPHLLAVIRELLTKKLEPEMAWNVNFPALGKRPLAGVRWDRVQANVGMYVDRYVEQIGSDGKVYLQCQGTPISDDAIPGGTDAEAVRQGYISIGKIRAF